MVEQSGAFAHRHERPDVVEHIDEQKYEDDFEETQAQRRAHIQLQRSRRESQEAIRLRIPRHQSSRDSHRRGQHDSDQHGGRHTSGEQCGSRQQTKHSQQRMRIVQVAQGHQRGGMWHNQARVAESDEGDEQSHAGRHRRIKLEWNRGYDQLADACRGQNQEGHAGDKYSSQGRLPGNPHALDDSVSEISV